MRNLLWVLLLLQGMTTAAQNAYWQQRVDYRIDVTLLDKEKALDGFEKIVYTNNSPDTLSFIWIHIWPNAYKNDRTAFSEQMLENGDTRFYFSEPEQRGYINRLAFKVDGQTALTEDHPQHIDIVKLILPKPLSPGEQAEITTPFHVKLPFNFSRGGFDGESFQVTQWYPKPAVYDQSGLHPMPYLDQGEFYSEFGSFDVRITVPKPYVVAATGVLQKDDGRTDANTSLGNDTASVGTKTLVFRQDSVHDFAWFANKDFVVDRDTCLLPSGRIVNVSAYYTPEQKETWQNAVRYSKDALRFYSREVGEYPYATATVVQGPQSFGGGMEYPTITVIAPTADARALDLTIAHELGHNWFYGILASNERKHPWMDEGLNSHYDYRYDRLKYGVTDETAEIIFQTKARNKTDQAIENPSEAFSNLNYQLVVYDKTAKWMNIVEKELGETAFRQMMHRYFDEWKFKHPQPEDFKRTASAFLGDETDRYFSLLKQKGILLGNEFEGFRILSPLKKNSLANYIKNPPRKAILLSPAIGFNLYDKLMLGGVITNYTLPPQRLQFLAIPLYATGSGKFTGLGKINYNFSTEGWIRKTDLFVNASLFSSSDYTDPEGTRYTTQFEKLVPGIRLTFREKDARSTAHSYLQWKTFLIREQSYRIARDTVFTGADTVIQLNVSFPRDNRYVNRLEFAYSNSRALYPYDLQFRVDQSSDFVRAGFTGKYFFNYAKGGGLQLRMFAGKFFQLNGNTASSRYVLNMSGANGYEDYTYSNYFVGRNEFDNSWSRQLMMRDGGFKIQTEALSQKVGRSDDWLMALNFSSTVPAKLNPLSVLPVKIPLRLFADVGTYAEPWKSNSELDRFLFNAGFSVSLLRDVVQVYFPVVYSKPYKDYFKSMYANNRFFKSVTFSIDLYPDALKKLNRIAEF
ncbi:MAG: M1 family metallopeptidase [Flavisolibacter sp.]